MRGRIRVNYDTPSCDASFNNGGGKEQGITDYTGVLHGTDFAYGTRVATSKTVCAAIVGSQTKREARKAAPPKARK